MKTSPIVRFQNKYGLIPDGIIGPATAKVFREDFLGNVSKTDTAHFLGQCHHESAGFTASRESLNYSPQGLINTFRYYKDHKIEAYADGRTFIKKASQKTIANKVYSDHNRTYRYRLGNCFPGDGWEYRGAGPIQITGYNNFYLFANAIGDLNILMDPDRLVEDYYFESARWYFDYHNIWKDTTGVYRNNIERVTKSINGGYNGLKERIELTFDYYKIQ